MPFSDEDVGDGNASDYDRAMSSSDDEDGATRQGKLPRYQYPTFHNDDDDSVGSHEDDEFQPVRKKRSSSSREDRIYGVFYTEGMSSEDEADQNQQRGKKRGGKKPFFKKSLGRTKPPATAPLFVKGAVLDPNDAGDENDADDSKQKAADPQQDPDSKEKGSPAPEISEQEAAAALEKKRRIEQANEHFRNLLQKSTAPAASKSRPPPRDEMATKPPSFAPAGAGLGFTSQNTSSTTDEAPSKPTMSFAPATGLGFQKSSGTAPPPSANPFQPAGLGFRPQEAAAVDEGSSMMAAGLGFRQFGSNAAGATQRQESKKAPPKLNSNLGKWEKHTKGIGAKLLAKMGYSGQGGLGSKKRKGEEVGVNGPIQVKVRPSNLGLGFGGFQEATHLNKQQEEAEKQRQEELDRKAKGLPAKAPKGSTGGSTAGWKSALPTVEDLLQDDSWRTSSSSTKGADPKAKTRPAKKGESSKANIISYQEILQKQQDLSKGLKIVDMRGPQAANDQAAQDDGPSEPPLAEELLHNISLLMGAHESKLYTAHQMESSTRQKLESMQADAHSLQKRKQELQTRHDKLSRAIAVLDEMEQTLSATATTGKEEIAKMQSYLHRLASTFSAEERSSFHFAQVLLPALLHPILNEQLVEQWDPFSFSMAQSEELIRASFRAVMPALSLESEKERVKAIRSIWEKFILPRAEQAVEDSDWTKTDGCVDQCVALYELLRRLALETSQSKKGTSVAKRQKIDDEQVLPPGHVDSDGDVELETNSLVEMVQKQFIFNTVHPKLLRLLSGWKPILQDFRVTNPLDAFVLPWLLHLDHPGILQPLLQDCRSKIRGAMSLAQKKIRDDKVYLREAISMVRPWRGVLKVKYMEEMVSAYITPKLARSMSKQQLVLESKREDWTLVNILFQLHKDGLLTSVELLSVVEGEILSHWCTTVCDWAQENATDSNLHGKLLGENYLEWKRHLLGHDGLMTEDEYAEGRRLLRNDSPVCRHFFAALLMIQHGDWSGSNRTEKNFPYPATTNYRVVLSRRTAEANRMSAEELSRMDATGLASKDRSTIDPSQDARVRLASQQIPGNHSHTPTFRDVVAEFARDRDILFQPRLGDNKTRTVDGKQVFLMGSIPVYLDSNVVYAQQKDKDWEPISLDELGRRATAVHP